MNIPCDICGDGRVMVFEGFKPPGATRLGATRGRLVWHCESPKHPRHRALLIVPALVTSELLDEPLAEDA